MVLSHRRVADSSRADVTPRALFGAVIPYLAVAVLASGLVT
jgi:hypothetical protein